MVSERSEHFELSTAADPETRRALIGHLETFHEVLEVLIPSVTGVTLGDKPVRVLLYEDADDYHAHVRRHAPGLGHNGGYYDGASRTVVSHRRANPLQLQFHEIAHAALGDVFDDPTHKRYARPGWPVWFDEGFAEYVSSFEVVPEGLKFGAPHLARIATLVAAIESHRTLSLTTLLRARPREFTSQQMDLWYATAWALIDLLVSEADLRRGVPRFVSKLRAGEDGMLAFREVFGGDLKALERRLYHRVRALGRRDLEWRALAPRGRLELWTAHDGGTWRSEAGEIVGWSAERWSYLTTPVPLSSRYALDLEVATSEGARVGLVLGRHDTGSYPYHTLISLDAHQATIRRVSGSDKVTTLVSRPFTLPASRWTRLRLSVDRGVLILRINGQDVLASRLDTPESSLVGLFVERGAARFKDPHFGPLRPYPAGPKATQPPGGTSHGR